jgi:biopolymer transport protein ExbD
MAEIQTTNSNKKNIGIKKLLKKSTKVDLTPMVDLGFLLITFFVFTTTMARATAMQMFEPKDGNPNTVPASGAMTILLGKENKVCYYFGELDTLQNKTAIVQSDFKTIRKVIANKKQNTPLPKLMFIIKSADESSFGHYAEDKISIAERKFIE